MANGATSKVLNNFALIANGFFVLDQRALGLKQIKTKRLAFTWPFGGPVASALGSL